MQTADLAQYMLWLCPLKVENLVPLWDRSVVTPSQRVAAFIFIRRSHVSVAYTDPEP